MLQRAVVLEGIFAPEHEAVLAGRINTDAESPQIVVLQAEGCVRPMFLPDARRRAEAEWRDGNDLDERHQPIAPPIRDVELPQRHLLADVAEDLLVEPLPRPLAVLILQPHRSPC